MTKDVAVVHWQDGGIEKKARAYTIQMLSQLIETMEKKGFSYYVCLTRLDTIIPVSPQKPVTAFNVPTEYIDKVTHRFEPHRAFAEAVNGARHPPNRDEVLKKYKGVCEG